jgi:hypothetical protein
MMSANPALMQIVNWASFARQAFDLFDFKNVDELLVKTVPMVNAMAQEGGMDPMALAGAASQGLQGLNPELVQMMGNSNPTGMVGALNGA